MKPRSSRIIGAVLFGCCGALLAAGLPTPVLAGDAADRQATADLAAARGKQSLNLARSGFGTHLEIAGTTVDGAAAAALLTEDDPLGYRLAAGATSMVLTLPKIETLHRFNFINLTAGGKVAVSVSNTKLPADSAQWHTVEAGKEFSPSGSEVVTCDLGSVEARYVKLDFEVQTVGSIDTFGLFGTRSLAGQPGVNGRAAVLKQAGASGGDRALLYNYAVSSDRAGVIMVSPGENLQDAQKMADGDMGTSFRFRADDPRPMAVIDLGESRPVSRIGMSFRSGPGHLDVYLLPDPEKRDGIFHRASNNTGGAGSGTRTIQEVIASDFPAGLEPVISKDVAVQPGLNRVSGSANEQVGRYLVMTFKPSASVAGEQTAAVDFKDFKDFKDTGAPAVAPAGVAGQPLDVPEISVFGNTPPGTYTSIPPILPNVPNPPGNGITVVPPILPPGSGGTVITP